MQRTDQAGFVRMGADRHHVDLEVFGLQDDVGARDRELAEALGPILAGRGLLLVGLDIIGDRLTEINVTSPTCFQEITQQTGFDVPAMFLDALEEAVDRDRTVL